MALIISLPPLLHFSNIFYYSLFSTFKVHLRLHDAGKKEHLSVKLSFKQQTSNLVQRCPLIPGFSINIELANHMAAFGGSLGLYPLLIGPAGSLVKAVPWGTGAVLKAERGPSQYEQGVRDKEASMSQYLGTMSYCWGRSIPPAPLHYNIMFLTRLYRFLVEWRSISPPMPHAYTFGQTYTKFWRCSKLFPWENPKTTRLNMLVPILASVISTAGWTVIAHRLSFNVKSLLLLVT